jgi:hypothetical protein
MTDGGSRQKISRDMDDPQSTISQQYLIDTYGTLYAAAAAAAAAGYTLLSHGPGIDHIPGHKHI